MIVNKKILILATVGSVLQQFSWEEICELAPKNSVHLAANFQEGNATSLSSVNHFVNEVKKIGVTVHNIPFSRSPLDVSLIKSYRQLHKLLLNNSFDLIITHTPIASSLVRLLNNNTPLIYTVHGYHFFPGSSLINWIIFYPIEKYLLNKTSGLIVVNQQDEIMSNKMNDNIPIMKVHGMGISRSDFEYSENSRKKIREELGLRETDVLLLSIGELNKNKNHLEVIKQMKELPENYKYIILGQGSLKNKIINTIDNFGVSDRVSLKGYVENVSDYLSASDIFLFPSIREGFPTAVVEAANNGLPIIARNIRGNFDLSLDYENMILVDDFSNLDIIIQKDILLNGEISRLKCEESHLPEKYERSYIKQNILDFYRKIMEDD